MYNTKAIGYLCCAFLAKEHKMTIENPQTHRTGEQGGVMPPEQQAWKGPDTDTEFPQQRGQTSPDTYQIPEQKDEEEPGFLSRHWGKVALATAGVVAAGAYYLSHGASHDSAPTNIPDTGSKPVATAEQHPGGSSPVTSVEAQSSTPETSADTGVSFGAQHMTIETAKATLFEVSQGKAPSAGEAAKQWGVALQNGMKMNASRDAVSQGGGARAVEKENLDLLTGADGILLGLGKDHNSISEAGADFMQPATLVYL